MNAKELRQAAKIINSPTDVAGMERFKLRLLGCKLAEYVLEHVKEDDDELLDSTWLYQSYTDQDESEFQITKELFVVLDCGAWFIYFNGERLCEVKTRGQLRRLLEALGVEE